MGFFRDNFDFEYHDASRNIKKETSGMSEKKRRLIYLIVWIVLIAIARFDPFKFLREL